MGSDLPAQDYGYRGLQRRCYQSEKFLLVYALTSLRGRWNAQSEGHYSAYEVCYKAQEEGCYCY